MSDADQAPDRIKIYWEYDKNYRVVAANGMWGGLTTRGDLHIDFFVESNRLPTSDEMSLVKQGESGAYREQSTAPEQGAIVRRIQVGMLIPKQHVASFMRWFKDKHQQLESVSNPRSGSQGDVN